MRKALDEGHPAIIEEIDTIADGLAPVIAGELTYEHARDLIDDVITVDDEAIREATAWLVSRRKLVVEYSGAAATAALLSEAIDVEGRAVAVVVSGGNLDPSLLAGLA
jgi:threonine dehydratase